MGLNLGADDYLAKPFNPLEAVARVNSNIRRFYALGTAELSSNILTVRDLELDPEGCVLKKNGEPIELTSVEYRIMELFMKHPEKCLQNNRSMNRDGVTLMWLQTIILWSASAS